MGVALAELVRDCAAGIVAGDGLRPQAISHRSGRTYQPGIGPHGENRAVSLMLEQMRQLRPGVYDVAGPVAYPGTRQRCDLGIGVPVEWAVEVKMARAYGDNGRLDDTYLKDLLSPYPSDHSAVGDAVKLATSGFLCQRVVLIYGFDYPERPLSLALNAIELLAGQLVVLGQRVSSSFKGLVHPVHQAGEVVAWEIGDSVSESPTWPFCVDVRYSLCAGAGDTTTVQSSSIATGCLNPGTARPE